MVTLLSNAKNLGRFFITKGPRYASLFITTQCNRQCGYCAVSQHQTPELTTEQWKSVIDRVLQYGVRFVTLLGGEPTLRTDLFDLVKRASAKAAVNVTTNGEILKESSGESYLRSLMYSGLSTITCSLHSYNDLEWQLSFLEFTRKIGLIPVMAAVATRQSLGYLPEAMKQASERGIFFRYSFVL